MHRKTYLLRMLPKKRMSSRSTSLPLCGGGRTFSSRFGRSLRANGRKSHVLPRRTTKLWSAAVRFLQPGMGATGSSPSPPEGHTRRVARRGTHEAQVWPRGIRRIVDGGEAVSLVARTPRDTSNMCIAAPPRSPTRQINQVDQARADVHAIARTVVMPATRPNQTEGDLPRTRAREPSRPSG